MDGSVWITGAQGLIGNYLVKSATKFVPSWKIRPLGRNELDLSNFLAVEALFRQESPGLIIHCAALSKSPACEKDPPLAWTVNFEITRFLTGLAADIPFLFFSTDLVFDGKKGHYTEADEPHPLGVYAETKLLAEKTVLTNSRHTVVRTSLNAGFSNTGDRSFIEEMRQSWQRGQSLKLFTDEFRCPIPASATARAVWELAQKNVPGLYHLAGSERLSRWEIGRLLAAQWPELNPAIEAASLRDYCGAPRSPDTSLDCGKIQKLLSFPLPAFSSWRLLSEEY